MHRKQAQDKKRANVHGRLIREITVATRIYGSDPDANSRLRLALSMARAGNVGKDVIARAIERGAGGSEASDYEEARYEGYGPGGTAVIVEALSDNRNRTASVLRAAFSKYGGSMGAEGSVTHTFERVGELAWPMDIASEEEVFEAAVQAGASDVVSGEEHVVITGERDLHGVGETLDQRFGAPLRAGLVWRALHDNDIDDVQRESLLRLRETLEDSDDVQAVFTNESGNDVG